MLMEEENRRLLQYAKEQQEREAERMAQEKKSEETKTLVYQKVKLYYNYNTLIIGNSDQR